MATHPLCSPPYAILPEMGERGLYRHTLVMAAFTALSRILGYIRDRAIAHLLGTSYFADAFYIAFRIPNTFRRFVAEGAMTASLVPVLAQAFHKDSPESAWLAARRFFWLFALLLIALGGLGVLAAPWMVRALAWEYAKTAPQVFDLTVLLTAIIFPYITFISLSAVAQGILNARDSFGPPAFTPVLLNLVLIGSAWYAGKGSEQPAVVLAWGVLAGGICQFLFLLPYLKSEGMSFVPVWSLGDERVRQVFRSMIPAIFGAGVSQIIVLVGTAFGHLVGEGAVSALYYANRITELAFGLFAVSLSTAVLPRMARMAAEHDLAGLRKTLEEALGMVCFEMLPATAGLLALSEPIVRVLLRTGSFSEASVLLTAGPLAAYAAGITLWSLALILARVCHSHRDTLSPFYAGLATLALYVGLGYPFLKAWGTTGIAAASSLSALVNFAALAWLMRRRHGVSLPWGPFLAVFLRTGLLSLLTGFSAWGVHYLVPHPDLKGELLALSAAIVAGIIVYAGGALAFRFPEAVKVAGYLQEKWAKLRART